MIKYNSYKNSGIKWIGEIPSHWKKIPLGKLGVFYGGLTGKKGEDFSFENSPFNRPFIPFTNISNNTYVLKDNFEQVIINKNEKQNKIKQFDLLFLMSSEDFDDLGKSSILIDDIKDLYLNSFCKGFRINHGDVYPMFLNYQLLLSHVYKEDIVNYNELNCDIWTCDMVEGDMVIFNSALQHYAHYENMKD